MPIRRCLFWLNLAAIQLTLATAASGELRVQGRVTGTRGGAPPAGTVVTLERVLDAYEQALGRLENRPAPPAVARAHPDGDGWFGLATPEIDFWQVVVSAPGHLPVCRQLEPVFAETLLEDVRLEPIGLLAVTVAAPGGEPAQNVLLTTKVFFPEDFRPFSTSQDWHACPPPMRTGVDGAATTLRLPSGSTWVAAWRSGNPPKHGAPRPWADSLAIALPAGEPYELRVVDLAANPVAGVLVVADDFPLGISDAHGSLRVTIPAGEQPLFNLFWHRAGGQLQRAAVRTLEPVVRLEALPLLVRGRALDRATGRPVRDALVWSSHGNATGARTDAEGRFEWVCQHLPPRLWVAAKGFPRPKSWGFRSRDEAPAAPITLELETSWELVGRVVDEARRPLGRSLVELRTTLGEWGGTGRGDAAFRTDPDGRFRWSALAHHGRYQIRASHEGYAPAVVEVALDRAEGPPVEIVLDHGARLRGLVIDTGQHPVAGATVELMPLGSHVSGDPKRPPRPLTAPTTTDAEGRFELSRVPVGRFQLEISSAAHGRKTLPGVEIDRGMASLDTGTLTLAAEAPSGGPDDRATPSAPERAAIPASVQAPAPLADRSVTGIVRDPQGRPLHGVAVQLRFREPSGHLTSISLGTGPDGRFVIDKLAPAVMRLEARWQAMRIAEEIDLRSGSRNVELRFPSRPTVAGRVLGPGGGSVFGASVSLEKPPLLAQDHSGSDGTFRIAVEEPGSYQLRVHADTLRVITREVTVPTEGVGGLEIRLEHGYLVTGKVSGPAPERMAEIRIDANQATTGLSQSTTPDFRGHYRLQLGATGWWEIAAIDRESGRRAGAAVEVGSGEPHLDLDLQPGALRLTGQVSLGSAAGACTAALYGALGFADSEIDREGHFAFDRRASGSYQLRIDCGSFSHLESVVLTTDQEVRVDLAGTTGRVVGKVRDAATGAPLAEVALRLHPPEASRSLAEVSTTSAADGSFEIPMAAAGRYRLIAEKTGFGPQPVDIEIEARGSREVEMTLGPPQLVEIEAKLWTGGAVERLALEAVGFGAVAPATDPSGLAIAEPQRVALPPGEWTLRVGAWQRGIAWVELPVRVPGGPYSVVLPQEATLELIAPALADTEIRIVLRPTDAAGRPLGDARATSREWSTFPASGRWREHALPAGNWAVTVEDRKGEVWTGEATTRAGAVTELTLTRN